MGHGMKKNRFSTTNRLASGSSGSSRRRSAAIPSPASPGLTASLPMPAPVRRGLLAATRRPRLERPEARPLIAAQAGRADCLLRLGQQEQARQAYLALLDLCQADEPGCRHPLSSLYAWQGDWAALQGLLVRFNEASCWLRYNKALMVFATEGEPAAQPHLTAALGANPHVPATLLGQRRLPKQEPRHWQGEPRRGRALCDPEPRGLACS